MPKHSKRRKLSSQQTPDEKPKPDLGTPKPDPKSIETLLNPYTKDQLIDLLIDAVSLPETGNSLYTLLSSAADQNPAHRKLFVHGLPWDATRETLVGAFQSFGEIAECKVVKDRVTGNSKGFGFVVFKHRESAVSALREPRKIFGNRTISCQLAVFGVEGTGKEDKVAEGEVWERKIYVTNVKKGVDGAKLRAFFEKFGEIERGPIGLDRETGKAKGYALFVYKTVEGARKALEEPYKWFDRNQLRVQLATSDGKKGKGSEGTQNSGGMHSLGMQSSGLGTQGLGMQNLGLGTHSVGMQSLGLGTNSLGMQSLGLNPMLGGLLVNPGGAFIGQLNPNMGALGLGLNQGIMGYGVGIGAQNLAGLAGYNPSLLAALAGVPATQLQGLQHLNPAGAQIGQGQVGSLSFVGSGYSGANMR